MKEAWAWPKGKVTGSFLHHPGTRLGQTLDGELDERDRELRCESRTGEQAASREDARDCSRQSCMVASSGKHRKFEARSLSGAAE